MVAKSDSRHMRLRLNAVYLHRLGYNFAKIAELLCVAKSIAIAYVEEFDKQNKSDNFPRGGKKENLTDEQVKDLIAHLEDKTYLKCEPIITFIADTYGVSYTKVHL
jgi:transposase